MKKNTSLATLGLFLLSLMTMGSTPMNADDSKLQEPKALNDDPGADCENYNLDIMGLKASTMQMYWKQKDCIRVYVTNNPFLFTYNLSFNEQLIKEDDPLSAFGGKFGLNVSDVSPSPTTHTTGADQATNQANVQRKISDATNLAETAIEAQPMSPENKGVLFMQVDNLSKDVAASPSTKASEDELKNYETQIDKLNIGQAQKGQAKQSLENVAKAAAPAPQLPPASQVGDLTTAAGKIRQMMEMLTDEYRKFSRDAQGRLSVLRDPATPLDKVKKVAAKLRDDSTDEVACLSGKFVAQNNNLLLLGCPKSAGSDPSDVRTSPPADSGENLEDTLVAFAHDAEPLHTQIEANLPNPDAVKLMDRVHAAAQSAAYVACTYQAFSDNDVNSIRTGLIGPLNSVLSDGFAFGYRYPDASIKREGPFGDPESVTMTLKRDKVAPFTTATGESKILEYTTSSFSCSGDPEDLLTNGSTYKAIADFFTDKPVKPSKATAGNAETQTTANLYMRNQNKPQPLPAGSQNGQTKAQSAGGSTPAKPAATPTASTVVLVQPWFFGKARLVLTGGLSTGLLTKTEFQRSSSISGTGSTATSPTVIGLKTNTRFRFTPMLYGHTLLYSRRHDSDAWYATLGVTANSDNKGTDPEFLAGFSRSWAQQKFFTTVGAYIGERQKLDDNLYVGETIPSSLTGELPVTKSYHVGWAFGLSYRFASTKDSQSNQSKTPAKSAN
jgi:hypothetical protein